MNFAMRNSAFNTGRVESISPREARRMADQGAVLLDVREHAEVQASGKARGAVHIPNALVPIKADPRNPDHEPRLSPERPVIVYCAAGGRAQMAGETLLRLGYTKVYNMGGFRDWVAAGGATE